MNDTELADYRKKKEKEKKIWSSMREIILYLMFIWLIFLVSYSKTDINSFNYQNTLKNLFNLKTNCIGGSICFEKVNKKYIEYESILNIIKKN